MNGITFLDTDTVIVKVEKLQGMMHFGMRKQMERLEERFKEIIEEHDKILTKSEVIKMLGIGTTTFDNWVRSGRLVAHKIGDKNYVYMSDIKKAMKPIN